MKENYISKISRDTAVAEHRVRATIELLEKGATVPFIARYRKEATGSLDEVVVTTIRDQLVQLAELGERRKAILKSLEERALLTDELAERVNAAESMTVLEDIYLPYRPKRHTRATIAREKDLEPLAKLIWNQDDGIEPRVEAQEYVDEEKGVADAEEALAGARDIMAEWMSEDMTARARVRVLYATRGVLRSRVTKDNEERGANYRDYFEWEELLATAPSHRVLAIFRGEKEGFLSLRISPPEEAGIEILEGLYVKANNLSAEQVGIALQDGFKRLLGPSIESEARNAAKTRADQTAIKVFADNLKELLLASPLGGKTTLAVDPGFRTGAKLACLDRQGKLLHHDTIYPLLGERQVLEAGQKVRYLVDRWQIESVAIGNGTGGRETEAFFRGLGLGHHISLILVNESGASIYSASEVAREEFPDHDLTVRGAVSIGRRLMDPLAELVKLDPRSMGVGQYQHDVDQIQLKEKLDDVVTSCVNAVGVDVNTASKQLLTYVSGIGPQLAKNIVNYRDENGNFPNRNALKKVPRLGPKSFEQAAGFLRVHGDNPLDASAVHPERHAVVREMANKLGQSISDLLKDSELRQKVDLNEYVRGDLGLPTLNDIMEELARPGRDPRQEFEEFSYSEEINAIEDIKPGMIIPGIVTNVTDFGAFIDIGVHQDGLVHISQLADKFVRNPGDVVKVQQKVSVVVLDVDLSRRRISLSMKGLPDR